MAAAASEASVHLRHVIPLDFDSLDYVPESHLWPPSDSTELPLQHDDLGFSLPVIDLDCPTVDESLVRACESRGMFHITNHGIPSSLLEEVETEAGRFFSLPTRDKMKALRTPGGAAGYGVAPIAASLNKSMWHEGFTMMGSPVDHAKEVWPHDYMRFCETMEDYQKRMKSLSEKILDLILKKEGGNGNPIFPGSGPSNALQLNSYPACPDPNRTIGLAPHTDTSLITIVHGNNVSGLQIFKQEQGWVSVIPKTNSLLVNVGDLLHIMSNAHFPNVLHRVIVNRTGHRLSIAYFYSLPVDFEVSPIIYAATCSGQVAKFRPVMVKDYVRIKAKNHSNALSLISMT